MMQQIEDSAKKWMQQLQLRTTVTHDWLNYLCFVNVLLWVYCIPLLSGLLLFCTDQFLANLWWISFIWGLPLCDQLCCALASEEWNCTLCSELGWPHDEFSCRDQCWGILESNFHLEGNSLPRGVWTTQNAQLSRLRSGHKLPTPLWHQVQSCFLATYPVRLYKICLSPLLKTNWLAKIKHWAICCWLHWS